MNGLADTIHGTCTPEGVPNTPPISGDITHKKTALMAVCAVKRGRPSPHTVFFRCKVRIAAFVCRRQEIENSFMKYLVEELDEIGQTLTHRLAANKGEASIDWKAGNSSFRSSHSQTIAQCRHTRIEYLSDLL